MRINEFKIQFLNYLIEYRGRSLNTKKAYDYDLTKFINYLLSLGIVDADQVEDKNIETYLSHLQCSTITKARVRSSIKSFFNFLSRKSLIAKNPTINLESMKLPEKSPEYLSQDQRILFLQTIKKVATPYYKERDLMLAKLLLKTGLRRAEIASLDVGDIDLSKHILKVKRKGNRETNLFLHDELIEDLRKYLKVINRNTDEPLFLSKRSKRLSASSIWHLIKSYSHKAGFNGRVTVHSLRHTFATTLLSEGLPLPYIQQLMGHRSSQTTSRYLHLQNNELIEAFNKITFEGGE
ncbi:MAG: tyrosine recombinase XerD [uncultured bacterium]|nr:MAG: tyrosine recombinase XerD [uncultured bacterium]OGH14221.1 MAG: hypothetical protein A2687_05860 [Candidatus Levybacteria bacterium RIFCSPHIGHO2_01_FULL_38_26]